MTTPLYPVFLKLEGLPVVVVGGGQVALSKLDGLLTAGARVTVVAPDVLPEIRDRKVPLCGTAQHREGGAEINRVTVIEAAFRPEHLAGARWVVAAATPDVNRDVAQAAAARGLFVNAVDDTQSATAYLGGVVRRGPVEIAISTGGLAPALAGLLREAIDAVMPRDLDRWGEVATRARAEWKRDKIPMPERRPLLLRALEQLYAEKTDTKVVS